ncbi:hypothetical protein CKN82_08155 [Carnobacterium divergens]|nr:hypothetical protein BFC22_05805 [Carnobacterium divergens]TFI65279.1 hypothetical protein CKN76_07665 [Carnobacterium divergens]TFI65311.1 hypothetical protein CKN59_07655 [Carnobacterium divergens]TFI68360.1 hypothetical protein CKN70_08205 [Carnobacterium divergens]TFI80328.1 hypothetical protein CKN74_07630 [Carnobacterium divergens]
MNHSIDELVKGKLNVIFLLKIFLFRSDNAYYPASTEFLYTKIINDYMNKSINKVRKNKLNSLKTKDS